MKKNMIWRSTFREIGQSKGRFLAILAIVALGVGFFAGLKVTKTAMVETTEDYFVKTYLYDYRLVSTLGFEQEDVDALSGAEGVAAVEGALGFDIIYTTESGAENVAKVHSLTDKVNQLVILEGRLPQDATECVVDANVFSSAQMGETLRLSENNEKEDLEHFAYRAYTIVGIAQSPLYIQYERGNTSLGNGRVNGFVYIRRDGFAEDYFTEVYVRFDEHPKLYSDAYEKFIDEKAAVWEPLTGEAANMRYDRILSEANEELADAKREFLTEKADAERELAEAKDKLDDAARQLAEGEEALSDAKKELEDGKRTLAKKARELTDAQNTITEKEQELSEGEQTFAEQRAKWDAENGRLSAARSAWQENSDALALKEEQLAVKETELADGEAKLEATVSGLQTQKTQLLSQSAYLDQQEAALGEELPPEMAEKIAADREAIKQGLTAIEAGLVEAEKKRVELESGKQQLIEAKTQLQTYRLELDNAKQQLDQGQNALNGAKGQLEEGQQEIEEGKSALEEAKKELAEGENAIKSARRKIKEGEETLAEKEQELADAKEEYEKGEREYQDGLAEYEERIADAEEKITDAEQELADLKQPETYVLGRDTNIGYVCFESDSNIVEGIANVFPVFFFLVAALVCTTTMNRMVEEQRTQIGVLKALGYGEGTIITKYIFYSGLAAVIGCVLGFAVGTWIFPRVIWTAYGMMYRVQSLAYVFDGWLALISLLVSLLCSVGTTWLSCRMELGSVPAQLMRPKAPKAGKRVFLEYLPFVWKRMKFLRKVSLRNIFRYKKRLVMMVLGISGCTALLVTGFGIRDSIAGVASQQFQEIQTYDVSVSFSETVSDDDEQQLQDIGFPQKDYAFVADKTIDLVTDAGRKSVNLLVLQHGADMSPFLKLHSAKGQELAFPGPGEVVLTDHVAKKLGIGVGDEVVLQDDEMREIHVTVTGINRNYIYNYAYIDSETYEAQIADRVEYKTAYLNVPQDVDVHLLSAAFMKWDNVTGVTVNKDVMERFDSMMKSLNLIVLVVILCAAGLAFIVLYNLTNINITERVREIATIKVLGFYHNETSAYVFRENTLLTAMGTAAGLILGHFLHAFVMSQINIDLISFDCLVLPASYLYSVLLTFIFAWLVNRLMGGKLEHISMTESLKSVD